MNVKRVLDSLNLDQIRTDLRNHYHREGPGRTPINTLSMLKAQLAKHLLRIISDRRLALARARHCILHQGPWEEPGINPKMGDAAEKTI